tara:strand:+ start:567 stop:2168 length:1602 start_codon:yes stop_codon:yes gene_type:complete
MNIKNKLKNLYLPINTSSLALFLSVLAIGYVASATNTPCLQAQSTCAIGGDNEFTGNISLKGNTTHSATIKVDPLISGDIELTLPNQTGTLALVGSTLAGSKIVATDINGDLTTNSYLPTGIGTAGQFLKVNPGATALIYADISEVPTLTNNAPYLKVNGTGEIDSSATLTADSPFLSVDGSGQIQAGTSTADAPFVKIDASGQLDSSATLTADSPFLSADANGQIQAGTIGAASTPLKSDANSQIVAADLVPEDDLTVGSGTAGQMLAVNSGGTALEFVDAGGGGQWTLVASGNSIGATGSTSGGTASNDILFCWGGANSTDGVDGSYFRMTNNKRYKIVFAPRNTGSGSSASTGYSGNAIQWIGNNVDCSSGAVNTSNTGATSVYEYSVPSWWYYWNKNPTYNGYSYSNGDSDCKVLDNQTIQTGYMPVSWQGEIIYTEMHNYWNGGVYGVKGNWNINFNIMNSQSPYNSEPNAYSQGICMNTTGTTQGGYVDSLDDMYGLLLKDYRPYTWGGQDTWVKYWLYEDNYYSSN